MSAAPAALWLAGCGNQYRPVVSAVAPVGPAAQPEKFAVAISNTSTATNPNSLGLVNIVDFSGDTVLSTSTLGVNPYYLVLEATGNTAYTLNSDGTVNSFSGFTNLLPANILQTTLNAGAAPVSIFPQQNNLYIAEAGQNSVAQLTGLPPALKQIIPTGAGTVYTVGIPAAPRVYAISQGANTALAGTVAAIETATQTVSATLPVGADPVYGVMSADARRAFILNKGSGTVTVINAQTNAADTFTSGGVATGTIKVGTAPVWADFAPTLTELLVANAGNGTTAGTVSVVNIPLCSTTSLGTNPNCDANNPVDAAGFGTVLASIPVGINPVMIAVLQDGSQAFVANAGNPNLPCTLPANGAAPNCSVSIINLTTDTVLATIPAISGSTAADGYVHGRPNFIAATTGTPTGKAYVTAGDSTDLSVIESDTDVVSTHVSLQGTGIAVRVSQP